MVRSKGGRMAFRHVGAPVSRDGSTLRRPRNQAASEPWQGLASCLRSISNFSLISRYLYIQHHA